MLEHQGAVFRTLTRLTGPGPHVEDLAQEAFLRLFRALPAFRGDAALATFLYRICFNLAQDEWKQRRREREHRTAAPAAFAEEGDEDEWLEQAAAASASAHTANAHRRSPEQLLDEQQRETALQAALLTLPATERAALVLFHMEECTYEAIAAALQLPINTVRTHLHRGRKHLAEAMEVQLARPRALLTPELPARYPETEGAHEDAATT